MIWSSEILFLEAPDDWLERDLLVDIVRAWGGGEYCQKLIVVENLSYVKNEWVYIDRGDGVIINKREREVERDKSERERERERERRA